ncbi:uncharacterized protein [Procambarus clarkii]|uniref:uncharacterized protein n=1 Tax=Procambarus clarkii TaxID=6728 RepID=UPI001E677D16|nr:uncharacterized protein LOC123768670 [Procambarus clarkii]
MLNRLVFIAVVSVACAASVEKRQGPVAQARDTGSSSSYAAPAPAPAPTYDEGSQGNLYYYYYPVSEYGSAETSDADFGLFTAIILPLLILGGVLLLLSSLTFTLTTQRALSDAPQEPDFMAQLHDEIERVFYIYLNAFESEQCLQRTICEMGAYSKDFKGKDMVLGLVEPLVPEGMKGNLAIFKKAAQSGYETGKCKKFRCVAPKLL